MFDIAEKVLDDTMINLNDRFGAFINHEVIQASVIINLQNWPHEAADLEDYGEAELEKIYKHFRSLFESRNVDLETCKVQWTDLKRFVSRRRKQEKKQVKKRRSKQRQGQRCSFPYP